MALTILAVLAAALGLAVIAIMVTPVVLVANVVVDRAVSASAQVRFLGGRAPAITLRRGGSGAPAPSGHRPGGTRTRARRRTTSVPGLIPALARLVRSCLASIHVRHLRVDADFGLDDPADTGALYGMLAPVLHGLPMPGDVTIALRPDFTGQRLTGRVEGALSLVPAALLPPALSFGWHVLSARVRR